MELSQCSEENRHLGIDSKNIRGFKAAFNFLTFNDSECDHGLSDMVSMFHPARVSSSILLPHIVDLQAVISPFKQGVGASCTLGPFLWPTGTPVLQTALLLSPNSAVDGGVANKPVSSVCGGQVFSLNLKEGWMVKHEIGREIEGFVWCLEPDR